MTPKCKPREGKETIYPEKGRRYLLKNCNKAPREANGVPFYTPQMNSKSLITKKKHMLSYNRVLASKNSSRFFKLAK